MSLEEKVLHQAVVTIDDRFECTRTHSLVRLTPELGGIVTSSEVVKGVIDIDFAHEFLAEPEYAGRKERITLWPVDVWPEVADQYRKPA